MLDQSGKGFITPLELRDELQEMSGISFSIDEIELFFERYNKQHDSKLRYTDYTLAFMPMDDHYARLQGMKRMQYLNHNVFSRDTMKLCFGLWELLIMNEKAAKKIRQEVY